MWKPRRFRQRPSASRVRPRASLPVTRVRVGQPSFRSSTSRRPSTSFDHSPSRSRKPWIETQLLPDLRGDGVEGVARARGGVAVAAVREGCAGVELRAELRAHAPGAVAHAEGVDGDALVLEPEGAGVAAGLVEVARGEIVRRSDRLEDEIHFDFAVVGVEVVELVSAQRLEAAVADAVREREVGEVGVGRERQVPEVLGVAAGRRACCPTRPRSTRRPPPRAGSAGRTDRAGPTGGAPARRR